MPDYDVIVIGAGIGGLVASAYTTRNGLRTLLLEREKEPGGLCRSFKAGEYLFDLGPNMFWGLGEGQALNRILKDLGLCENVSGEKGPYSALNPAYQLVSPTQRINVSPAREELMEELGKAFPKENKALRKLFAQIDELDDEIFRRSAIYPFRVNSGESGLAAKKVPILEKGIKKSLSALFRHPDIKSLLLTQAAHFGMLTDPISDPSSFAFIASIPKRGLGHLAGGSQLLAKLLSEKVQEQGGKINLRSCVEKILVEEGRVAGVKATFESIMAEITAPLVICNLPPSRVMEMVNHDEDAYRRLQRSIPAREGSLVPIRVLIGVGDEVIPSPMKENLLLLREPERPLLPDNLMHVNLSPLWDKGRAPDGKRAIAASVFADAAETARFNSVEEYRREKSEEVILGLEQVVPFLSDHIDFIDVITPFAYERFTGRRRGLLGNALSLSAQDSRSYASQDPPIDGLYLVGDHTFPGHGTPCAAFSGMRVAEAISRRY